jgi:hypothetical protein
MKKSKELEFPKVDVNRLPLLSLKELFDLHAQMTSVYIYLNQKLAEIRQLLLDVDIKRKIQYNKKYVEVTDKNLQGKKERAELSCVDIDKERAELQKLEIKYSAWLENVNMILFAIQKQIEHKRGEFYKVEEE